METPSRTLLKALSWQGLGLIMMTIVGYLFTGSISAGGGIAAVGAAAGFLSYIVHERLWARVTWGQRRLEIDQRSRLDQSISTR